MILRCSLLSTPPPRCSQHVPLSAILVYILVQVVPRSIAPTVVFVTTVGWLSALSVDENQRGCNWHSCACCRVIPVSTLSITMSHLFRVSLFC